MKPVKNEPKMSHEARIAVLETSVMNINANLLDLKQELQRGFDKMEGRFERLENRMWSNFLWLMGMIIGLAGLIAHT